MDWIRWWGLRCTVLVLALSVMLPGLIVHGQADVQVTVLPDQLNVRDRPGFDAATIGDYPRGTVLYISGWDGTVWVFARPFSGDLTGWVHWDYVDFPAGFDVGTLPIITATGAPGTANETPPNASEAPVVATGQLTGSTVDTVNLRSGPGTTYSILQTLPAATPLVLAERNADATWLKVQAGNQTGWLFAQFVSTSGAVWSLPEATVNPATSPDGSAPAGASPLGIVDASVIPTVGPRAREIFLRGQELGNRPNVFIKVGDSITDAPMFLTPIGLSTYDLGSYSSLSATINYFMQGQARTGNPFVNTSAAARGGWTSYDLITVGPHFLGDVCNADESPLLCEFRLSRPSVALIMIGTNDVTFGLEAIHYRHNIRQITQLCINFGVIPVLSTMPDNFTSDAATAQVYEFNNIVRSVAAEYGVPLWDYWRALQGIPRKGMSDDGIHPNYYIYDYYTTAIFTDEYLQYGYNIRNLTALLTLEAVWRGAMY